MLYVVFKTLLKLANRYNLELKYSSDYSYNGEYCNNVLIMEEKSVSINHFVERIYRNELYVETTSDDTSFEIYSNNKRLCNMRIYKDTEVAIILKKIEQYSRDCNDYCDFLYKFATALRQMG